ncbi:MAG: hypothetical protein GX488_04700, partial [Clostridiales bacterium]|nr:hypothetical protein [Clostridiales bacterium]
MGQFSNNSITENGRLLLADIHTGGEFVPTRVVMGSGYIPAGKTARTMTDVVSLVKSLSINKIQRTNDGKVIIGGVYSNADITVPFYFRELALYARCIWRDSNGNVTKTGEEKLYSYGNAGATADLMPAYSTGTVVEKQIDIVTYVGNDTAVSLELASGVYLTAETLDDVLKSKSYQTATDKLTEDTSLDSADFVPYYDTSIKEHRKVQLGAFAAWLKSVLSSVYAGLNHTHTKSQISDFAHKSAHSTGGPDAIAPADIGALSIGGDGSDVTAAFTMAEIRDNIATGEKLSVILGKVKKWFADLGTAAFQAASAFAAAVHTHVRADITDFPS